MLPCLSQATVSPCLTVSASPGPVGATKCSFSHLLFMFLQGHLHVGFGGAAEFGGWEQDQAAGADVCACWRGGRGRRGPDGALCSCGGLSPRSQQDGGAGLGFELGFGCLSLRGGCSLAGQRRTHFPPTSLVPAVLSMAMGTRGSLLHVAAGSCLIPALVGVGDGKGTWTSVSLPR